MALVLWERYVASNTLIQMRSDLSDNERRFSVTLERDGTTCAWLEGLTDQEAKFLYDMKDPKAQRARMLPKLEGPPEYDIPDSTPRHEPAGWGAF